MASPLVDVEPPPDVFSSVMATGIVSIAAAAHGYHRIAALLTAIAAVGLSVLAAVVIVKVCVRRRFWWDGKDADVSLRLFTFVAACAVMAVRLARQPVISGTLGALAVLAWLVLTALTIRNTWSRGWARLRDGARGSWLLASVATFALATVTAEHANDRGVLTAAVAMWLLGITVYCLITWLILWHTWRTRLDPDGCAPDSWILMGGLAIATLAGDHIHRTAALSAALRPLDGVEAVTTVTWVLATLWIPPLTYIGLRRIHHRAGTLQFAGVWWAAVFPLGMYSAATHATAREIGQPALQTISLVFFWIALTAWLILAIAGTRLAIRTLATARRSQLTESVAGLTPS